VGNLSWYVSWQDLKDAFTAHGATYADVKYHPDGRSKGWGIVRFTTADEARAALAGELALALLRLLLRGRVLPGGACVYLLQVLSRVAWRAGAKCVWRRCFGGAAQRSCVPVSLL
jgi:hypothetical protein